MVFERIINRKNTFYQSKLKREEKREYFVKKAQKLEIWSKRATKKQFL